MTTEQDAAAVEDRLRDLLHSDDVEAARATLSTLHPADQGDFFDQLDEDERGTMLSLLDADGVAALFEHMDEDLRREVAEKMPRSTLAQILDRTENDIAVDILHEMAPSDATRTLAQMTTASEVLPLLQHEDETAGGIMTRGYVALHKSMTVTEAMNFLRATRPLAEEAYYLYVLDRQNRLEGVVNLRQLVVSPPNTKLADVMVADLITVAPDIDQEEAARLLQHYRLRSIPVVDPETGVLSGIITADDIIDVIQEEATEDMYRMAGLPGDESIYAPVFVSARKRIPWLLVNLVTAFAAGGIVAVFEGTIAKAAALAVFMPIIAGQGGNAGIQTVTLVVRGIALGEIEPSDARAILSKEAALGLIRGVLFGLIVGIAAYAWKGQWAWGLVVGGAMLLNMLVAGLMGTFIPLGMRALKIDPAIASGVFLTTFTDVLGFLFLLGFATILIGQLT
ncbi:MAG: magnesium transporter [Chloroflexota bacterium]